MLSPGNSPGIIDIDGDLTIDGSDSDVIDDSYTPSGPDTVGTIQIEIGGTSAGPGETTTDDGYDQINVAGEVSLGGKLELVLVNYTDRHRELLESLSPRSIEVVELNLEEAFIEYTRGPKRSLPIFAGERSDAKSTGNKGAA